MTLVAGIADEHSGVASSMFNAGQQIGGAVSLAVIGSIAWTVVNNQVKNSLRRIAAGPAIAGHAVTGHAVTGHAVTGHAVTGHAVTGQGGLIYHHALSSGVTTALSIGAGATVLALVVTLVAIRVRRQDLPASPLVM